MRIAFTFDDGPIGCSDHSYSIRIQNVLKQNHCNATFFYIGNKINDNIKAEIKRAHDLGFEVGNHTFTHPFLTRLSEDEVKQEVLSTELLLTDIIGKKPDLFRAPYMDMDARTAALIDYPMISCAVDSQDYTHISTGEIIRRVLTQATDGAVILLHETYPTTAAAVEYLVPYLTRRGHEIVSVSELYRAAGKTLQNSKTHTHTGSEPQ